MSVELGGAKFGVSIKYNIGASANSKTKTVSGLNLKLTNEGSGNTPEDAFVFFDAINSSIIGGTTPLYTLTEDRGMTSISGGM